MKKTIIAMAVGLACAQGSAYADMSLEEWKAKMEQRMAELENKVQEQDKVIQEKDQQIAELSQQVGEGGGSTGGGWFQSVEIGGAVEVEASHNSPYTGSDTSDITVATVELGVAAQINDWVSSEITLLYEEDDTNLEVDVAVINLADPDAPWFVTTGQQYVPFGAYETNLLSDPLTLEIGETRETAIQGGFEKDGLFGALYVFNGSNKQNNGSDDEIDNWGAALGFAQEGEDMSFALGAGYINDIGDSDALQDKISANLGNNDVADHVGGWTANAMVAAGAFTVIGEYTAASDEFQLAELPFNGRGAKPKAWNIEVGYGFTLAGKEATFAVGYQGTDEALNLELPERRTLAALSVAVLPNTALTFEWAHDEDYGTNDGGTDESADTATAQLAVEF